MVHETFIAPSVTVCKPPNASLAVTHKTYSAISHGSYNKRRKIQHLCLDCQRALIYVAQFSMSVLSYLGVMVMCSSLNSEGWIKTVQRFNGRDVSSFWNNVTLRSSTSRKSKPSHDCFCSSGAVLQMRRNKHGVTRKAKNNPGCMCGATVSCNVETPFHLVNAELCKLSWNPGVKTILRCLCAKVQP